MIDLDKTELKEEPDEVACYEPPVKETVKKDKDPICGRTGVGLLIGAIVLWVALGTKVLKSNMITAAAMTLALLPLVMLLFAGSLALAIISIVRKERGSSASITICGLVVCFLYYVFNII